MLQILANYYISCAIFVIHNDFQYNHSCSHNIISIIVYILITKLGNNQIFAKLPIMYFSIHVTKKNM